MEMVDFVSALGLDAGDFFGKYLLWNKPCLIDGCMTSEWRARREWVKERQPDLEYLKSMFGKYFEGCRSLERSQLYPWNLSGSSSAREGIFLSVR